MENRKINDLYKNIGRAWCPALNEYVAFTNAGLRHLVRKNGKRRSRPELKRRFSLLPYAKEIIEDKAAVAAHGKRDTSHLVKQHGMARLAQERADFWTITKTYGHTAITVVIRQTGVKEKHFFSIYDSKLKNQKTAS